MALKIEVIQRLDLGIQGEHNVRPIRIDCTGWLDQFPNGSIDLMHKRNGDEVQGLTGASFDRETKILTWLPTEYDTYYSGEGFAEIRLTEGTSIKMKKKALTLVRPCIVNDVGDDIDSSWQAFIDEVTRQKSEIGSQSEAWAVGQRNGVDVDEEDETYHNNSKYYALSMAEVKDEYIEEIEAAGEAAKALIPEDLDYYAPAADVEAIKGRFTNGILKVDNGGTGASTAAQARSNLGLSYAAIGNLIYPVGSIYMSASNTSPATLFGGTWEQVEGKFLLGADTNHAAGSTGGAASASYTPAGTVGGTSLIQEQMPAHSHGFTPAGTIANHSHSFTPAGTIGGNLNPHSHTFTGQAHLHYIQGSSHAANVYVQDGTASGSQVAPSGVRFLKAGDTFVNSSSTSPTGKNIEALIAAAATASGSTGEVSAAAIAQQMAFTGSAGTTAAAALTFTGTAGSTGIIGGGAAHDHSFTGTQATIATMPPYLSVYVWKRLTLAT